MLTAEQFAEEFMLSEYDTLHVVEDKVIVQDNLGETVDTLNLTNELYQKLLSNGGLSSKNVFKKIFENKTELKNFLEL